jgi:dienelactone hydrolase
MKKIVMITPPVRQWRCICAATALTMFFWGAALAADLKLGPQGDSQLDSTGRYRQQEYRVPFAKDGGGPLLQALLLFPKGNPPYPLVIINHGRARTADGRSKRSLYPGSSRWFAERGFVVLTLTRRGYGESEGHDAEGFGPCNYPNYAQVGNAAADDIEAGVRYMREQPYIDRRRIVLVGQSVGGWAVLAAAARNMEIVVAVLNFAGGHGSSRDDEVCTPERLIETAAKWGKTVRVPTLWIYAENDKYFGPKLARAMFDAYRGAGGTGEFLAMPPFSHDGHRLFGFGWNVWGSPVDAYLRKIPDLIR